MPTKKLHTDHNDNQITATVTDTGNLFLEVETFAGDSITVAVPKAMIGSFVKSLTDIATAPEWTRAKFVRVKPHGYPSYTMVSTGENTWKSEHGTTHNTYDFLGMPGQFDIEVIA